MSGVIPSIGAAGRLVVANVETLRAARGWSYRELSARFAEAGRPVGGTGLHAISQYRRRIDVDDLAVFAEVLGTTAASLLGRPLCAGCLDAPPAGFTCNTCGAVGAVAEEVAR